jgi:hypothetical protein
LSYTASDSGHKNGWDYRLVSQSRSIIGTPSKTFNNDNRNKENVYAEYYIGISIGIESCEVLQFVMSR